MYAGTFNDPKKLRGKRVKVMDKNTEIHGACQHKTTFHRFCQSTEDSVITGERVRPLKGSSNLMT